MKVNKRSLGRVLSLMLFLGAFMLTFAPSATLHQQSGEVSAENKPGLHVITFDTPKGRVIVYLPDDMAAGDTISGTVRVEPKGNSGDVQYSISETDKIIDWVLYGGAAKSSMPEKALANINISTFATYHFTLDIPGSAPGQKPVNPGLKFSLKDNSGATIGTTTTKWPDIQAKLAQTDYNFETPHTGQQGRPTEIPGRFDGNFANTTLKLGGQEVTLLAESPRKVVFQSPTDLIGTTQIQLNEAGVQTQGSFRNVGVRLSAPKTHLLKGEQTELKVQVVGLEGIKLPVPLQLSAVGVIAMDAGNFQNLRIAPAEVNGEGTYTTTRTITGQESGSFTVTATVVVKPFDICIASDSAPGTAIMWNSFTGDYLFRVPGATTMSTHPPRQAASLSGAGKLSVKGCIITLVHNAPDRRVMSSLDTCNMTGEASVWRRSPKATFTITDMNTSDNVCVVR